ncbi:SusC/RagA family TonB-linked outer membrane protein [Niabella sp. 22666]|uniref:SusC/RagA family TonB-linked outer membrane protein n=1 Tax=Niabella sp. 22666 TaxID=3453954 RepID=UPI003F87436D
MKKTMQKMLLALLMSCTAMLSWAQQRTITGTVTDDQGAVLTRATYIIKGTTSGGVTDEKGNFSAQVNGNTTVIVFSSVGYKTTEVSVGQSNNLNVVLLAADATGMDEVVVTALGIKREARSLGYATSTIKGDELLLAGATQNPFLALYGKAAGVGINIGSGGPTAGVNVRIRGAGGLESNSNTRPLFVVDGVPIYDRPTDMVDRSYDPLNSFDRGSGINDLNSEDIESMEILKGAKASVLYGSQALNGVVLITTKSGRKTRGLGIQASHQMTFDKPFTFIDFQNEYGSGASVLDTQFSVVNGQRIRRLPMSRLSFGPKFDGVPMMLYDSTVGPYQAYPDNFIDFFRNAVSNRTNVAIAGGGPMGSVRASYTHNKYEDILPGFNQKQHSFSFNGNFKVSEFATFEFINNLYSVNTVNRRPNIAQFVATGLNRDYDYNWMKTFYRDAEGFRRDLEPYGLNANTPGFWPNAVAGILWEQNDNQDIDKKFHLISSVRSTLQFSKAFSFIGQASIDYTNTDIITQNKITRLNPVRVGGKYAWNKTNSMVQNYQGLLKFDKSISDFDLFAFAGAAYQRREDNNVYASTGDAGLLFPDWFSLNNADTRGWASAGDRGKVLGSGRGSDVLYSLLGSATLSYKSKYYLEIQARNDWNSTLKYPNNSYFYPGASLTWNFSDDFKIPKLQFGKFRFSWADVGGGPSTALTNRYFANDVISVGQIPYPSGPIVVTPNSSIFLADIVPFRKREFEAGFNTRWFKGNRLEIDLSYYTNNLYNQIVSQPITPATGASSASINTGNHKNWGFELFVKGAPITTEKYRWELTYTAASQSSKVISLYPGLTQKSIGGAGGFQIWQIEGQKIGQIRGYDYKRDPNGNRIVGTDGNYDLSEEATNIKGKTINPALFGGLYSDFFFKGFNFHFGVDYKFGGTVFSYTNNYLLGLGVIKESLPGRDEANGGLAYYIDNTTGNKVPWQHNQAAPAAARGGIVYHDGIVLDGVKEVTQNGATTYSKNDIIVSAPAYYQTFISDVGGFWPTDRLFKNDYIKLREISMSYTLPAKVSQLAKLQKVTLTASVRNLGYLYKTVPNIDTESALGSGEFVENSFYPSLRSFIFGVNVSF